jgi:glycosyltransferase involved in cell wall biosynthesis
MALISEKITTLKKRSKKTAIASSSLPTVSVIVAVQNQKGHLVSMNQDLQNTLKAYGKPFEIIYVDDGSNDGTWIELGSIAGKHPNTRAVKLRSTFGEASVLDAGMQVAAGEEIIYFTCRVKIKISDLANLLEKLDDGFDIAIGVRHPRRDSRFNRLVSKIFNALTNRMTKIHLRDINSGVLATRKSVLENVPFYGTLSAFLPVLAHRQGYKVAEAQIEQLPGHFTQSLYPKNYIRRFLDLISVIFLSKYSKKPLHFLGFLGAIFAIIGAGINVYLFFYRILGIGGIAGKPMLLLGTMLLIIGIQFISIGLLGEIIIFTHAKNIKDYNIEEIIE